ncbi:MAG TPA: RHS repeat-associated core domain-containing protein, partial [Cyclobacteriaceae bacterium]
AGTVVDGSTYTSSTTSFPFAGGLNGTSTSSGSGPKAYLNWLVFDKNYVLITSKSGYTRMTTAAKETGQDVAHEYLSGTVTISDPGYVYVYLSNEEGTNPYEVYFDDFKVTQVKSAVIQSQDYYPFGLTFNSYSRESSVKQDYLYNGKELQDELNLGWLDYGAREYMPEVGRFICVDRMGELSYKSLYSYAENNPINNIDVNGDFRISADIRRDFPLVTKFIEKNLSRLSANVFIINSISKNTGLDFKTIRKDFSNSESSPMIDTDLNHTNMGMGFDETQSGQYFRHVEGGDENDYLAINSTTLLKNLEAALSTNDPKYDEYRDTFGFMVMVTILHEYIHHGSDETGFVPAGAHEVGWHWEGSTFKRKIRYPTMRMALDYGREGTPKEKAYNTAQSYVKDNGYMWWQLWGMGTGTASEERSNVQSPYHKHEFKKDY